MLSQLSADEAAGRTFHRLLDLVPSDDRPFVLPLHPDARQPLSFKGLHAFARSLEGTLSGIDSARVAIALPNGPTLAVCILALSSHGVACAPLNPDLSDDESRFELDDLPAGALVLPLDRAVGSSARLAAVGLGIHLIELESSVQTCGLFALHCAAPGVLDTRPHPCAPHSLGRETTALLMHTSGTTRRPKLVPLSHRQLGVGSLCVASTLALVRKDVTLNVMPLYHLHGLMINVFVSAVAGAVVVCAPRFLPSRVLEWLTVGDVAMRAVATWYSAVPTVVRRHCGTQPITVDHTKGLEPVTSRRPVM